MLSNASVDEAVCDIEAVRPDEEHEDRGEYQFGSPAHLRSGEGSDGRDKPRCDSMVGRSLGLYASPRRMGGELTTSLPDPAGGMH